MPVQTIKALIKKNAGIGQQGGPCTWYKRMDGYRGKVVNVREDRDHDFRTVDQAPPGSRVGPSGYTAFRPDHLILNPSETQIRNGGVSTLPERVLEAVEENNIRTKEGMLAILEAVFASIEFSQD